MFDRLRKKRTVPAIEETKLEMTPMIDCVFLLLIFFMCSLELKKTDGIISAFLPKNRGLNTDPPDVDPGAVRVKLLWLDPTSLRPTDRDEGVVVLKVGTKVYPDVDGAPDYALLYEDLVVMRGIRERAGKDPCVIIDGRAQVPFEHVVAALNACVKARIEDVTFAAPENPY